MTSCLLTAPALSVIVYVTNSGQIRRGEVLLSVMVFACVYVVYSKMRMVPKEIVLVICGIHLYLGKGFCEAE